MSSIQLSTTRVITPVSQPAQLVYQTQTFTGGKQVEAVTVYTGTSGVAGTVSCFPGLVDTSTFSGTVNYVEIQNLDATNNVTLNMRDGNASPASNTLVLPAGGSSRVIFYNVSVGTAKAAGATWPANWTLTGTAVSPVQVTVVFG